MDIRWECVGPAPVLYRREEAEILGEALRANSLLEDLVDSAAASNEPVLLIVNDGHRATRTRSALAALAEVVLSRPRLPRFRALVACGSHQFPPAERAAFEKATFEGCGLEIEKVAWHEANEPSGLAEVAGVRMHRWVAAGRFLLPIGSVEPHYFAGVTGAHKTVTIGCLSGEDIERNHGGAIDSTSGILRLRGNPVFDDVVRILGLLESAGKTIYAINEVIRGDVLTSVAAGDPLATLDSLLSTVRRLYVRSLADTVDVLRLKVPLPLGRNFYQADKALKNNHQAVRNGGGIVLEAACPEGIGPDAFLNLLRKADDYAGALRAVTEKGYRLGDHKAVQLRYLTDPAERNVRVAVVSSTIGDSDARTAGMRAFADVDAAIDWLAGVVAPMKRGLVVEDAGLTTVSVARS